MGKGAGKGAGKGGDVGPSEGVLPKITSAEVAKHNTKEDSWLVIDGKVYDISKFILSHPGGRSLIRAWQGRDATAPYTAFHPNLEVPGKYLKSLVKGEVAEARAAASPEDDLATLVKEAREEGLFDASYFFYAWNLLVHMAFEVAGWAVLATYGSGWAPYAVAVLLLSTAQAQLAGGEYVITCQYLSKRA